MANTCREAIVEIFANESGVLETKQVTNSIYTRYPDRPWKPNTIAMHLVALSDHPSNIHHPSHRRHRFLVSLGNGRYRRGNAEEVRLMGGEQEDPIGEDQPHKRDPQKLPPVSPASPKISVTADDLGRWRRNVIRLLNALGDRPSQPEGVVARILRLTRGGTIPRTTSALMVMLVEMRNAVEYEEVQLSPLQKETVWSAWRAILEWSQTKGITLDS
jgi:hypothetical protein